MNPKASGSKLLSGYLRFILIIGSHPFGQAAKAFQVISMARFNNNRMPGRADNKHCPRRLGTDIVFTALLHQRGLRSLA